MEAKDKKISWKLSGLKLKDGEKFRRGLFELSKIKKNGLVVYFFEKRPYTVYRFYDCYIVKSGNLHYINDYFIEMGYEANKNNSVKIGRYYDDLHNHVTLLCKS